MFSLPVRRQTHDVTVRLAGVNPDQLAIEKKFQSPIFTRRVSVAVTDLKSLHLLFHCGYSLQDGRRSVKNFCAVFSRNKFHANRSGITLGISLAGEQKPCQLHESLRKSLILRDLHRRPPPLPPNVSCWYSRTYVGFRGWQARVMPTGLAYFLLSLIYLFIALIQFSIFS